MLSGLLMLVLAGPWSDVTRGAFAEACEAVFSDAERPAVFCGCMLRHTEGQITEAEFLAYLKPEPAPSDEKVGRVLHRAMGACRGSGTLDI